MDFHFALKIQLKPQINCKIRSQKILWESSKCVKKACPVWNLLRKKINLALYLHTLQDLFNIFYILVPVILSILRFANSAFLSTYVPKKIITQTHKIQFSKEVRVGLAYPCIWERQYDLDVRKLQLKYLALALEPPHHVLNICGRPILPWSFFVVVWDSWLDTLQVYSCFQIGSGHGGQCRRSMTRQNHCCVRHWQTVFAINLRPLTSSWRLREVPPQPHQQSPWLKAIGTITTKAKSWWWWRWWCCQVPNWSHLYYSFPFFNTIGSRPP